MIEFQLWKLQLFGYFLPDEDRQWAIETLQFQAEIPPCVKLTAVHYFY